MPTMEELLNGLALAPPDNVVPDPVNLPNMKPLLLTVTIVCFIIPTLVVWMRAYVKYFLVHRLHLEDCESSPL